MQTSKTLILTFVNTAMIYQWIPGFLLNNTMCILNLLIHLLSCSPICNTMWQSWLLQAWNRSRHWGYLWSFNTLVSSIFPVPHTGETERKVRQVYRDPLSWSRFPCVLASPPHTRSSNAFHSSEHSEPTLKILQLLPTQTSHVHGDPPPHTLKNIPASLQGRESVSWGPLHSGGQMRTASGEAAFAVTRRGYLPTTLRRWKF